MTQMTSEVSGSVCACVSLFQAHSQSQCGFDLYKQQTAHSFLHTVTHTQHPHSRRTSQVYQRTKKQHTSKTKMKTRKRQSLWMIERKRERYRCTVRVRNRAADQHQQQRETTLNSFVIYMSRFQGLKMWFVFRRRLVEARLGGDGFHKAQWKLFLRSLEGGG